MFKTLRERCRRLSDDIEVWEAHVRHAGKGVSMKPIIGDLRNVNEMHHYAYRLSGLLDAAGTLQGERRDENTVRALLGSAEDMAIALRDLTCPPLVPRS